MAQVAQEAAQGAKAAAQGTEGAAQGAETAQEEQEAKEALQEALEVEEALGGLGRPWGRALGRPQGDPTKLLSVLQVFQSLTLGRHT